MGMAWDNLERMYRDSVGNVCDSCGYDATDGTVSVIDGRALTKHERVSHSFDDVELLCDVCVVADDDGKAINLKKAEKAEIE